MASQETILLISSMIGPLTNKIKACLRHPRKNKDLAANADMNGLIVLIGEQLLPQWCQKNMHLSKQIEMMHDLIYLLAQKVH